MKYVKTQNLKNLYIFISYKIFLMFVSNMYSYYIYNITRTKFLKYIIILNNNNLDYNYLNNLVKFFFI